MSPLEFKPHERKTRSDLFSLHGILGPYLILDSLETLSSYLLKQWTYKWMSKAMTKPDRPTSWRGYSPNSRFLSFHKRECLYVKAYYVPPSISSTLKFLSRWKRSSYSYSSWAHWNWWEIKQNTIVLWHIPLQAREREKMRITELQCPKRKLVQDSDV